MSWHSTRKLVNAKMHGALKIATWIFGIMAAVVVAMDPTVKVALIAIIPLTITSTGTLWMAWLTRRDARKALVGQAKIEESINGHFGKLMEEKEQQHVVLMEKTDRLAHAEGRREGIESKAPEQK
jgi:hypothetical protein